MTSDYLIHVGLLYTLSSSGSLGLNTVECAVTALPYTYDGLTSNLNQRQILL